MKHCSRLLALSLLVVVGACAASTDDSTDDQDDQGDIDDPALPDAPGEGLADLPAATTGLVMTPTGLVDHSCVQQIDDGDTIDDDGVVTRADGTTYTLAACSGDTMPVQLDHALSADTEEPVALAATPAVNGWMEAAWWNAPRWMKKLTGHFIVPPEPSSKSNQTVFFFPSLTPASNKRIIQPVLQWGPSAAGGGKYWAIASWYVGKGITVHSKLRRVSSGDRLYGSISGSKCSAAGHCTWTIVTKDLTHKKSTTVKVKSAFTYDQVQGGVLEAYGLDRCNELPRNGDIAFTDLAVHDGHGTKVKPHFSGRYWDFSCRESVIAGSSLVFLNWN